MDGSRPDRHRPLSAQLPRVLAGGRSRAQLRLIREPAHPGSDRARTGEDRYQPRVIDASMGPKDPTKTHPGDGCQCILLPV